MINTLINLPFWFVCVYVAVFGLCIGSFLNVVILRGLKGEEIVFSSSRCPKCLNKLKWYMNIPVFSYVFLKGKCGFCKEPISKQYPIVELLNCFLYVLTFACFDFSYKTLFVWIILSLFIVMCICDIKEMVIIDLHSYIFFIIALLASSSFGINPIYAIFYSFLVFILFEYLSLFGLSLIKTRIFGSGDSLILLGISAMFGLKDIFLIIALSFIIQIFFSIPSFIKKEKNKLVTFLIFYFASAFLISIVLLYFNISFAKYFVIFFTISLLPLLFVLIKDIKGKIQDFDEISEEKAAVTFSFKDIKNFFASLFGAYFIAIFKLYKNNQKLNSILYVLYIPFLIYLGLYAFNFIKHNTLTLIVEIIASLFMFYCVYNLSCVESFEETKIETNENEDINSTEEENSMIAIPFGPALMISTGICIFYMENIKDILNTIINNYTFMLY